MSLTSRDILFVDEVHRLNRIVEESLYPAMEDFMLDVVSGRGTGAQVLRLPSSATLIGATTRAPSSPAPCATASDSSSAWSSTTSRRWRPS